MQTDKELLDKVKNSFELEPRPEFVRETKRILITKANRSNKLYRFKEKIKYTLATALTLTLIIWLSFFNGTEYVTSSFQTLLSTVNQNNSVHPTINSSEPTVFIYHTHNTESFMPLLDTDDTNKAFDKEKNITMVGKRIADILEMQGINVLHDNTDIVQQLENRGLEYEDSYLISGEIVKNVLDEHESIKLVLDIHRDSLDRSFTTTNFGGTEVPRISFVIYQNNSNYEENFKVAELLHETLEDNYPGVSRGITISQGSNRGSYNQDLFRNSLLIEIGGFENTLEEEYRGAEIISDVIIDVLDKLD
ncbi:stage II sporulation protein P [Oceanobacillus luteolus]|uniref:Stage II sporulation protein P n=1 Tax=Oceanobacillus luteolus TaxID=1274358 RepID=A0ABW4HNB2_9BACI|nr:stage II sporulation protein P [Oceanobacillus luteolus]MCM3742398.1 stage II sporulation protein P [Oceanobacillus luteolus]